MRSSMVIQKSEIDRADDIDWHQLEAFIDQGIASCRQPMKVPFGIGLQIADEHAAHVFGPALTCPLSSAFGPTTVIENSRKSSCINLCIYVIAAKMKGD